MNYSIGDKVMKQGSSEPYTIIATKEDQKDHRLEEGFDYLIQKESDADQIEHVFQEDIDR